MDISDSKNGRYSPNLSKLTKKLETEGIIDSETLKSLDEIRDVRNKIVHPKDDISSLYQPTDKERLLLETVKDVIRQLLKYRP